MPARRKKLATRKKKEKKKPRYKRTIVLIVVFFSLFLYQYFSSDFRNTDKISLAIVGRQGEVVVSTFDWQVKEITNIIIPANTQVELARQFGVIKIKNVWQLGYNEDLQGRLLIETLTRHFKFPVTVWADTPALGLTSSNIISLLKAVFIPYKTNLRMGDRLRIAFFSLSVQNSKRVDINLADSSYLKKERLIDGEEGYVIYSSFPDNLRVIFSNPVISQQATRVVIRNATSKMEVANSLGEIVEILGAKVISIDKQDLENTDCRVVGTQEEVVESLSRLFSCEPQVVDQMQGGADAIIEIGEKFAERY